MTDKFEEYTIRTFVLYQEWPERKRRLIASCDRLGRFFVYAVCVWLYLHAALGILVVHHNLMHYEVSLICGICIGVAVLGAGFSASRAFLALHGEPV